MLTGAFFFFFFMVAGDFGDVLLDERVSAALAK